MRQLDRTSAPFISLSFVATLIFATLEAGCATHATAVSPAPVIASEVPKLQAALMGSCEVTQRQLANGDVRKANGITMTFTSDGHMGIHIDAGLVGTMDRVYNYHLDGRNITSDGIYRNMRVDDWSGPELKLFMYDNSETYICRRA